MVVANVTGRLVVNDLASKLAACVAGQGVAQTFALGVDALLERGELVQLLPDWSEERFPLYVYYPSRHLLPAKVRAFIDFVEGIVLPLRGSSVRDRRDANDSRRSIARR
jgi:DNA-binding transcriptional LysR family regulator